MSDLACDVWYATCPENIVAEVPVAVGATSGCVCPSEFVEGFDRGRMLSTDVYIGRTAPSKIPPLLYSFPGDVPAGPGTMSLNTFGGGFQDTATIMYVSRTQQGGADVTPWLRFINNHATVTFATANNRKTSRGYGVTATPIERSGWFEIPITWTDGTEPVPDGLVEFTFNPWEEVPIRRLDDFGIAHYGLEPFQRVDLINSTTDLFETFADRILQIRGSASVPRVESVTIDARRGEGLRNAQLMSQCQPGKPSRYKIRLNIDGRFIYDRMCFATKVQHHIAEDQWTTDITLDVAEWAAT